MHVIKTMRGSLNGIQIATYEELPTVTEDLVNLQYEIQQFYEFAFSARVTAIRMPRKLLKSQLSCFLVIFNWAPVTFDKISLKIEQLITKLVIY